MHFFSYLMNQKKIYEHRVNKMDYAAAQGVYRLRKNPRNCAKESRQAKMMITLNLSSLYWHLTRSTSFDFFPCAEHSRVRFDENAAIATLAVSNFFFSFLLFASFHSSREITYYPNMRTHIHNYFLFLALHFFSNSLHTAILQSSESAKINKAPKENKRSRDKDWIGTPT